MYATHMTNILMMFLLKVIHGLGIPHALWMFMHRKVNIAIVLQCVFHSPFIANCFIATPKRRTCACVEGTAV